MSLISYTHSQTSIILRVKILDSSVSTGAGVVSLTSASSGLIISTIADNEATATAYTVAGSTIETITTLGTYAAPTATKCRFKEVDATNHKGLYEIQIADARFAVASAKSLAISISGAPLAAETDVVIPLTQTDPYDNVAMGITGIPSVAAGAAGGAPTNTDSSGSVRVVSGTSTGEISLTLGKVAIKEDGVGTDAIATGAIAAGAFAAGAITSTVLATGAITSGVFASNAIDGTVIADGTLDHGKMGSDFWTTGVEAHVWGVDATSYQTLGTFGQAIGDPVANSATIHGLLSSGSTGQVATYTAIDSLNDLSAANVATELATYDGPTRAELTTDTNSILAVITTAQSDLDLITGTDGATLATAQGNYAPATVAAMSAAQTDLDTITDTGVTAVALTTAAITDVWATDALTESYAADTVAPTPAQFMYMIWSYVHDFGISGTLRTSRKLDNSNAMTHTLNHATEPTDVTRAT